VLPYVLRKAELPMQTLCQLLCTSQATSKAVNTSCAGSRQLKVDVPPGGAVQPGLCQWLERHAVLLQSLDTTRADWSAAANSKDLTAALAKAAALPDGLMLQSLSAASLAVLQAASCSSLTSLQLCLPEETLFPSSRKAAECIKGASVVARAFVVSHQHVSAECALSECGRCA
jgi:hypothetical protein